ncbi:MAG: hypothetical protein L0287_14025 [Anaerolineae bacterium]|nr:hypothetical protein [Anaerolineae bacterium]
MKGDWKRFKERPKHYLLMFAVIGLTLISVTAGFSFYHTLFGLTTAILCCVVFETLRLACLWSLVNSGWLAKILAIPVYTMTTLTCAFVAITSFHAEIIESHTQATKSMEQEMTKRIDLVRRAYVQRVEDDLRRLYERIDQCNRKLALYPASSYWHNRLVQLQNEREARVMERNHFLETIPTDKRKEWIEYQAAMLGLTLEPLSVSLTGSLAFTTAINELWGITEVGAKKIVSIIIVTTSECGIILLSLLVKGSSSSIGKGKRAVLTALRNYFDETEIKTFFQKCNASLSSHGRLPLSRQLGKKQREMRRVLIESLGSEDEVDQPIQGT